LHAEKRKTSSSRTSRQSCTLRGPNGGRIANLKTPRTLERGVGNSKGSFQQRPNDRPGHSQKNAQKHRWGRLLRGTRTRVTRDRGPEKSEKRENPSLSGQRGRGSRGQEIVRGKSRKKKREQRRKTKDRTTQRKHSGEKRQNWKITRRASQCTNQDRCVQLGP